MFSIFFIERPKFALVVSIVLTLAGLISMSTLPIAEYPAISPVNISVVGRYPGASAEIVEQTVATPIEDVPAYLRSLTVMQAEGNLVAEVVIEVEDRARAQGQPAASAPVDAPPAESSGVRYRSVQLRFDGSGAGGYSLSVPESPAGAGDSDAWSLNAPDLENALWANARRIEGSARRATGGVDAGALLPRPEDAREAGKALYSALFDSALPQMSMPGS